MVLAHDIREEQRTQDVKISNDVTFETMLLTASTLEGLTKSGFLKPSPIQLHGIPLGKCGFDLLLEAKSGTGKTAVFTVIALEKLDLNKGIQTIILAPTREIAAQICDVIRQIGSRFDSLNVAVVMGGLPIQNDIEKLKSKTHILVGSPGRLRHLIQDKHIDVSSVRLLVLDEADKLMEKSFQVDIKCINSLLPKQKQVIMSSATYPVALKSIIENYVQNAQHICPDSTSILLGIKQLFTIVKSHTNIVRQTENRFNELRNILSKKEFKQCLIFCNYQVRVVELCKMLMREKWPAEQLHGRQEQFDRLEALKTLQEYKCRILVSTDLAARGIDASNVDLVINFEPPYEWPTYLHRIGRAGRFGSYGIAITILSEGQEHLKFKKMLSSMNVTLDLRNLWDDEPFHQNDSTNLVVTDDLPPSPCSDQHEMKIDIGMNLWDVLTQDKIERSDEVSCFEELVTSFNNCNDHQIASFNDFLNSFDSHQDDVEEENPYKPVKFHKISINDINPSMAPNIIKAETDEGSEEINNGKFEDIRNTHDLDNEQQTKKAELNSNALYGTQNSIQEISINSINTKILNTANKYDDQEEVDDLYKNTEDMNKALINAGLPTSFGKHTYAENKRSNNENTNYVKKPGVYNGSKTKITKDSQHKKHEDDGYNLQSQPYNSNYWTNVQHSTGQINEYKTYHFINQVKSTEMNYFESKSTEINADLNYKNYVMWYSQLKKHVKQVEMALYIEELCKMK